MSVKCISQRNIQKIIEGTFIDQNYVHKELAPGRIKKDIEAVEKGINLLENIFTNLWNGGDLNLTSLSTGIGTTAEVKDSLLDVKNGGFSACLEFIST